MIDEPHHAAMSVTSHCCLLGRYSKNTAVSKTRFPPAPNALRQMNSPKTYQFGDAPATIVKMEEMNSDTLNAKRRPMISAEIPQKSAPTSIPTYTAIVNPVEYDGWNSYTAWVEMMDWISRIKESTAYLKNDLD